MGRSECVCVSAMNRLFDVVGYKSVSGVMMISFEKGGGGRRVSVGESEELMGEREERKKRAKAGKGKKEGKKRKRDCLSLSTSSVRSVAKMNASRRRKKPYLVRDTAHPRSHRAAMMTAVVRRQSTSFLHFSICAMVSIIILIIIIIIIIYLSDVVYYPDT